MGSPTVTKVCPALILDVHLLSLLSPGQIWIFWVLILVSFEKTQGYQHVSRLNPDQLLYRFIIDDFSAIAGRRPSHLCIACV